MPVSRNAQSGFGLAELLVAIVILAVGLLGLAELQISAMKGNSKSGSIMAATSVAQTAIEEIMSIATDADPLYNSVLTNGVASFSDWPNNPVRTLQGSGRYQITYKSTLDVGGVSSKITKVTVKVDSLDGIGFGPSSVTLETLKDLRKVVKL